MKSIFVQTLAALALSSATVVAQHAVTQGAVNAESNSATDNPKEHVVLITGVRFAYPLVQHWIDEYNILNPDVQLVIESRGSTDPAKYDILIEGYDPDEEAKKNREQIYVARYAILPVANSNSAFAGTYGERGLNKELINQIFFYDLYAEKEIEIKAPYTTYTRLQKAGSPTVFARYFGYEQKDIKGKSIAGSDEHLLKAVLRDSTAVSYLPLTFIYDHSSRKPIDGLKVLPVDLNGNGKISEDERIVGDVSTVIQQLERSSSKERQNIPVEYIHFSIDKNTTNKDAIDFLQWVISHGEKDLHDFGYLTPEPSRVDKSRFEQFASKRTK